jgi:hypothetical protein
MSTGEAATKVKTFISVSYSLLNDDPDHLLRQEVHRVKDEDTNDFVTVSDTTTDVGEKDDYSDYLQDEVERLETQKEDTVVSIDDSIEILEEQIAEIDSL